MFQAELENKLQQQSILSAQELKAEKVKLAELQKTHEKQKENMEKLQLDLYGKESELLATRQDLKVLTQHSNVLCHLVDLFRTVWKCQNHTGVKIID